MPLSSNVQFLAKGNVTISNLKDFASFFKMYFYTHNSGVSGIQNNEELKPVSKVKLDLSLSVLSSAADAILMTTVYNCILCGPFPVSECLH